MPCHDLNECLGASNLEENELKGENRDKCVGEKASSIPQGQKMYAMPSNVSPFQLVYSLHLVVWPSVNGVLQIPRELGKSLQSTLTSCQMRNVRFV